MTDPTMLMPAEGFGPLEQNETCRTCRWWREWAPSGHDGWGPCEKVFQPDALFYPDGSGGVMTHADFHCNQYEPVAMGRGMVR